MNSLRSVGAFVVVRIGLDGHCFADIKRHALVGRVDHKIAIHRYGSQLAGSLSHIVFSGRK